MSDPKQEKSLKKNKLDNVVVALDPTAFAIMQAQNAKDSQNEVSVTPVNSTDSTMLGSILKALKTHETQEIERLSFEIDPQRATTTQSGVFRMKLGLTPDNILKRVTGPQGDELVNCIIQARSNHLASMGRPRTSRFSLGTEFEPIKGGENENYEEDKDIINQVKEVFWHCGYKGMSEDYHYNLSQFLKMLTRDALTYGRAAVEMINRYDPEKQAEVFHAFRVVDAGTIYRLAPHESKNQSLRNEALRMLKELKGEKFIDTDYEKDVYKWVQVIEGRPVQVFTEEELIVYNFYPVSNVEYNGYPLTPIDQALNAIMTHINITIYNKLYFQHGRAAKGMLVFQSDDIDESTTQRIRNQFYQSINSVNNAWRVPLFAIGAEDTITWQSTDVAGRDAEFQYLADQNSRVILSAFQMSPEELPGYAHLSRGSNSQALSESNNEYKMTAARDVGLRPLVYDVQDLLNTYIFPRINQDLSKRYQIILAGLDAADPDKENTRLMQGQDVHLTQNQILEIVEKRTLPKELGGDLPLSQKFWAAISPYLTVGQILEGFMGVKDASKDPRFNYIRDPFYMQQMQLNMQMAQMKMQQDMQQLQMMQQQAMGAQQPQEGEEQGQEGQDQQKSEPKVADFNLLSKAINDTSTSINRMILDNQRKLVRHQLKRWKDKSKEIINDIVAEAEPEIDKEKK